MIITQATEQAPTINNTHDINPFTEEMQHRIFESVLEDLHTLEERDHQHLQRIAELEEENQTLRDQLKHSEDQRVQQYLNHANLFDWLKKLMSNTTIPSGCKMTYIFIYMLFTHMRHLIVNEEMQVGLTEIAAGTGQSTSAVRAHLTRAAGHDLLTRRDEKQETKEGDPRTIVHLTLLDAILEPEHINLEKAQGGQRQKGCKVDGTPLDNWTVRHCPEHGEVTYYGQPGLRKEADTNGLVDAIIRQHEDRIPLALNKKQDAFDTQHSDQLVVTQSQASTITLEPEPTKQDAFDQAPAQLATQHTHINSATSCYKPQQAVCTAQMPLNKFGKPAHGLEKIVSWKPCGSTRFVYSSVQKGHICAECLSDLKPPTF